MLGFNPSTHKYEHLSLTGLSKMQAEFATKENTKEPNRLARDFYLN